LDIHQSLCQPDLADNVLVQLGRDARSLLRPSDPDHARLVEVPDRLREMSGHIAAALREANHHIQRSFSGFQNLRASRQFAQRLAKSCWSLDEQHTMVLFDADLLYERRSRVARHGGSSLQFAGYNSSIANVSFV